jgi:hypothetical protein
MSRLCAGHFFGELGVVSGESHHLLNRITERTRVRRNSRPIELLMLATKSSLSLPYLCRHPNISVYDDLLQMAE